MIRYEQTLIQMHRFCSAGPTLAGLLQALHLPSIPPCPHTPPSHTHSRMPRCAAHPARRPRTPNKRASVPNAPVALPRPTL